MSAGGFPTTGPSGGGGSGVNSVEFDPPLANTGTSADPVGALADPVPVNLGGTGSSTGNASALTNIPGAQVTGNVPLAAVATALATGGGAVKGTILTATTRTETPTIGTSSATQHALPTGTGDLASLDATQTLSNKTITSPTFSGTISGTYTLGGTPTFPSSVVTTTGTQTLTNKTLSAPVLSGSATGTYTLAGTPTITSPAISGPTFSGTLGGTYTIGGTPTFPASVVLTSGAQTFTGQKTFPAAGTSAVVLPAVRQASAGNDITVPAASGADSFALLAQTQTLTNKTLTAPVLSGTVTGTYVLGGNWTLGPNAHLGGNLNAFNFTVTSLANPTPGSTDAATAQYVDARAAAVVTLAIFGSGPSNATWNANTYIGINSITGGAANPGVPNGPAQWVAPCNGTLKLFQFFSGGATSGSTITFTVYQNGSATAATMTLTAGSILASSSASFFIFAGDFFCLKTDTNFATGAPGGFSCTAVFIPAL